MRRFSNQTHWSLVVTMPSSGRFANRFLGIVVTLLLTAMIMIYFYGKERRFRDFVQMDKALKLQELASDLRLQATTDPLTGLFNRLKFNEALASEMLRAERYNSPLSLILYDVDHFKAVNDTHGHQAGDKVLVNLSRLASASIRHSDLLARWGGEEFVILVPGCDAAMAREAAEKLRTAISDIEFEEVGTVSCSFGVAEYVEGESVETLIARVDEALYQAKVNGRNRVELSRVPVEVSGSAFMSL